MTTSHLLARPIVSVPAPGSGITWSAAPSITSRTRSPNGASRSICSVVAPGSSSITRLGYARTHTRSKSARSNPAVGRGALGRSEPPVDDPQRDPAGDLGEDLGNRPGVTDDVDEPDPPPGGLDPPLVVEG